MLSIAVASLLFTAQPAPSPLTLDELARMALDRNLRIAVSRSEIDEARALHRVAASTAYPALSFSTLVAAPTPEARTRVVNDPSTITPASIGGDLDFGEVGVTVRGGLQIFQPIHTFGKIRGAKRATRHLQDAAEHKADVTAAEIVYEVHQAYWSLQLVRSFLESLAEGEETLEGVLEQVRELLDNESEQVTTNDRLRLQYALGTLRVREAEARAGGKRAVQALKLLVGLPPSAPLEVAPGDLYDALPEGPPPLEVMIDTAKRERPEVRALVSVVEAQRDFVKFRRAGLYPDFLVGGIMNYAYTSNATDQTNPFIFDPYNIVDIGVGVGIRWELNIFTKLAELEQAKAQLRTRELQERLVLAAIELEVRDIHAQIEGGYAGLKELKRAHRSARGWLTATVLAYDIGTGDAKELIDAFLAWAASEAELQSVRYDTVLRFSDLARASGRLLAAARERESE